MRYNYQKIYATMNRSQFWCPFCSNREPFSTKSNLNRHLTSKHGNSSTFFECAECGSRYKRKDSLKVHVTHRHADDPPKFDCAYCSKTFRFKHDLLRHIAELHPDVLNDEERNKNHRNFECFHCSSTFSRKYHLRRHIQKVHLVQKPKIKESRFKCLKCSNVFCSSKVVNKHYVDVHGVMLNYQKLEFDCIQSYKQWLENHQHETLTRFTIWYRTKKAAFHTVQRLVCHRSGDIRSSLTVESRKRCLKTSGYKRLGGICPAEIRLYIRQDGTCFIKYQKTHVGHNIGDESELGRLYLTDEEKKKIAAEIESGVPLAQIVNRKRLSRLSGPDKNTSRLGLVTRQDVRNIAVSQNLGFINRKPVQPGCDSINVEVKVAEHKDDIVFYKRQTEKDSRFNLLQEEDFVLVIITSNQEKYLRTYGHKIVCLDGNHSTNSYGFSLHTLLVFDMDEEGLPAAFLLTNRNDQCVIDIFLTCVRDRVGILKPHTIIADMQTTYYNSWAKIMNDPTYYLFCTWHVHEDWRKNYCKIPNKQKRDDVRAELLRLSQELDPIKFENGLESFLSQDDDELLHFQRYFRQNYGDNTQRWAYCFRTMAGINTNMTIKSFHKSFKYNLAGGQKIESLTQCLVFIFDYLTLLETNIFEKNVRGKVTNKLRILRNRHREAFNQYEQNALSGIIFIDSDMYMVQSFEKTDNFYTIVRHESKECHRDNSSNNNLATKSCRLVCDWCNLCFHAFRCTCEDSSIKSNMCKHIHLVGLYLKNQPLEFDTSKLRCTDNETDIPISYTEENENSSSIDIEDTKDHVLESVDKIEDVSNKQTLIRRITERWEEIRNEFTTFTENELQRIYNRMEPLIFEVKSPETHTRTYNENHN